MDTPVTTHAMAPTGIVTPHPTLATSSADLTHTTPQTRACLNPAPSTTQHRNFSPEKPNNAQDPQLPINPIIQRLSGIQDSPQSLHQNQIVTPIL